MKKLVIISALAATSTVASAFDYKFNLEGRADFVNADTETTTSTGVKTTDKYNNFSNGLVRLNLMGTINENLSYRFRYRFLNAAAAPTSAFRENVNSDSTTAAKNGIDYLFVDHKNEFFTTRFGKQNWSGNPYGREGMVSGTDVFLVSQAATNYKAAFGSDYRFGVTAMFKFMDTNTLDIAISNPNNTFTDATAATTSEAKNTGLAMGAYYTGSFLNKMVQPVLAYTTAKQNGNTDEAAANRTKDVNYTMMNVGLRSEVAGAIIDADYKALKRPNMNDGSNATAANILQETKSIYVNAAYPVGDFTPMFTYINDKFDSEDNTKDSKKSSFAVGTYWKPMADVNFRYHAMFTSASTKADGGSSTVAKVEDKKIYFGFKADI